MEATSSAPKDFSPSALALALLYVGSMAVNGLVSTGSGVPLQNKDISFSHPTFITPQPYAFAIWAIIYLLLGAVCVVQALPRHARSPFFAPIRPWLALALACNCGWLVLFGNELFWTSFLVIAAYLLALCRLVQLVGLDLADLGAPAYATRLLAHCAFAANASWVLVATLLQLQLNLLDEGYFPSADLSVAMLLLAAALGSWRAYAAADAPWAAAAAWALVAIRANQQPGSDWGCLSSICASCEAGRQRICTSVRAAPLGWAAACAGEQRAAQPGGCVLERSGAVAGACAVGVAMVAVALAAGAVRGGLASRTRKREGDARYRHM